MKKITFLLALAVWGTDSTFANSKPTNNTTYIQQGPQGTPAERAERQTAMMTEQLALTADQTKKVKEINLARATEMQTIRDKANGDRDAMMQGFQALRDKYNGQFKAILTADQYAKYEANMAQMRGNRGGQ